MRVLDRLRLSPSVATWGSFVARALCIFALAPLMLAAFPEEEAAIWFALITLQGMQLLFGSSLETSFVRALSFARGGATQVRNQTNSDGTGEPNMRLYAQVWTAMGWTHVLLAVLTATFIAGLGLWSIPHLLRQSDMPQWEGYAALGLFVFGAMLRAYIGRHISFLFASGRIPLLRWTEAAYWGAAFTLTVATLALGGSLLQIAFVYQVSIALGLLVTAWLTRRDQKRQAGFDRATKFDFDILRQLWPAVWRSSLGMALFILATQGAGLYYARIGEPADVAAYLFAMSLMRPMIQFGQVPFITKLPMLAQLQASGDRATQLSIAARAMMLSNAVVCIMALGIAAALEVFVAIGIFDTPVPPVLWAAISVTAIVERVGAMHLQLYSTTNHILWHWANGITAVLFVIFAALLLDNYGALAFPLAQLFATALFYTPFSMYWSYRAFSLPWPKFEARASALPMAMIVIYFCLILVGGMT
ncbi:MAG: hypothetical protein AAF092_15415 [Pseudomonadota bacterium]